MQHPLGPLSKDAPRKFLIIAAHPDDETLSASALLRKLKNLRLIHATDGAPANLSDARRNGFRTAREYAQARREELISALRIAEVSPGQLDSLEIPDQECAYQLAAMTRAMLERIHALEPEYIVTHAYEGGHPDHDSTAFAAHAACRLLRNQKRRHPKILEFAGYHGFPRGMAKLEFLPPISGHAYLLSPEERSLKSEMLARFRTQRESISLFPVAIERLRLAPSYDFLKPPHPGVLYYESQFMRGGTWRELARKALEELSLEDGR